MAEVLKAETKAQLREPEGFSAVEAGGCTDRPHNDRPADGAAQNQTPRSSACVVKNFPLLLPAVQKSSREEGKGGNRAGPELNLDSTKIVPNSSFFNPKEMPLTGNIKCLCFPLW